MAIQKLSPGGKLVDLAKRYRHDATYNRRREIEQSEYIGFYHSSDWQAIRKEVLARDYGLCQRCGKAGNIIDHIIPSKSDVGRRTDPTNLQTLCRECHDYKTKREWIRREKGTVRAMNVYLVCGLSTKAKLAYIKSKLTEHDLIFDYDLLMQAQTGLRLGQHNQDVFDYLSLYFEQFVRQLRTEKHFTNVWITSVLPRREVIELLSPYFEVKKVLVQSKSDENANLKLKNQFKNANFGDFAKVVPRKINGGYFKKGLPNGRPLFCT